MRINRLVAVLEQVRAHLNEDVEEGEERKEVRLVLKRMKLKDAGSAADITYKSDKRGHGDDEWYVVFEKGLEDLPDSAAGAQGDWMVAVERQADEWVANYGLDDYVDNAQYDDASDSMSFRLTKKGRLWVKGGDVVGMTARQMVAEIGRLLDDDAATDAEALLTRWKEA